MRTVDPATWSKKFKKRGIQASRCNKFGRQPYHRYEVSLRESLFDVAFEYMANSSLPAVKYINMEYTSGAERYCYIFLLLLTFTLGILVVSYNCHLFFMTPPLVITRQSDEVFITDVSFPAVALCSNNIISKMALQNYSEFLFKYCYIFLLLLTFTLGILVVSYNCHLFFMTPPLVITRQSDEVFITDVSFPAVALCSNNIISKMALQNYSEFLFNHHKNKMKMYLYSRSEIEANLRTLGALLTLSLPPLHLEFDTFLHDVDPQFNVTDIMFRLTPPCSSVMTRCSWRGRLVPCETLFAVRATPLGFCCVFNSRYYSVDAHNKPHVLDLIGQNFGLGVVMTEDRDDFQYVRRNSYGGEMLLFEGSEYPLLESGDVRMYPIPKNQSVYLSIRSMTQHAKQDIMYYNEEWRGCRNYGPGQSWCLSNCRRATAAALCGCVPYALHAAEPGPQRVCALRDLPCLNKHREKFMYLYPGSTTSDEVVYLLSEEIQNGLICEECRVLCRRQLYVADISYSAYLHKHKLFRNFLTEGQQLENSSTIRLFYNLENHDHYSLEAYMRWYEAVVQLSAQWTVVGGVSILCAVELIYHLAFRLVYHFVKRIKLSNLPATST